MSSVSYAQSDTIEAATWAEALERVHCPLRLVNEPDGSYSVRGPFSINGERFVNSTPIALEVLERLKRGCGVVGGGAGGANGSNAASANGNYGSSDVEDSAFQSVGSGSSGPSGTGADVPTQTKNFQPEPPPAGVPSPIAGAGLPGLLAGLGTMLAWFRKRRAARVSHRRFLGGRLFPFYASPVGRPIAYHSALPTCPFTLAGEPKSRTHGRIFS